MEEAFAILEERSRYFELLGLSRGPLIAAALSSTAGAIGVLLLGASTPVIGIVAVTLVFGVTVGTFAPGNQDRALQPNRRSHDRRRRNT